ncbi:MAG: hypothetical protein KGH66_03310 [Candidatus Micrarchaeota archaeon]|nr:hypothetical protein [Candidatus Micrarchaeota archaeon]
MRRIILLLIVSTIAYALVAVFSFSGVHGVSLPYYFVGGGLGALIGAICVIKLAGFSFRNKSLRSLALELSGGLMLALSSLGVYALYTSSTLAGAQPLLGVSVLIFLAMDFILFGKVLRRKESLYLLGGVLAVAVGIFVIQSNGLSFNYAILPILVFIMFTQGIGYYLMLYGTSKKSSGIRLLSFPMFLFIIAFLIVLLQHGTTLARISAVPFALVVLAGISLSVAISFEIIPAIPVKGESRWDDIVDRNLVNDFTYMDILIVLGWSVLLGSYTLQELAGGLVILSGILVLNKISSK